MASNKIKGTAIVNQYAHKSGGSVLVLGNFSVEEGSEKTELTLKNLAKTKSKKKELVTVIIEPVQKTLIKDV